MPSNEEIRRWSAELARDPGSFVFLPLGEALRQRSQHELAAKIAQRGVERHPMNPDAHALAARIAVEQGDVSLARAAWLRALELDPGHEDALHGIDVLRGLGEQRGAGEAISGRREAGVIESEPITAVPTPPPPPLDSPTTLFDSVLEYGAQGVLVDEQGLVLAGAHRDAGGDDTSQELAAQLSGMFDEAVRATHHLELGRWRSILVETGDSVIALGPAGESLLVVVTAPRATPLGMLRRFLTRASERSTRWLRTGGAA